MAARPKLLVLDEPAAGLSHEEHIEFGQRLRMVPSKYGITIIIIEQFVHRALHLADQCGIMCRGEVSWAGAAADAEQAVLDSYLGESASV